MKRTFPRQVYNFITLIGAGLALFGLAAIIILYLLTVFAERENPYIGIFVFLVFPAIMVAGLLLIPVGMWREKRRMERGATRPLILDLGNPHHRNAVFVFLGGTSVFLLVTTVGLYEGYHYSESVTFCGTVCHQVMQPEHTAYLNSSHAQVDCVQCHIGPGAGWFVRSKLSGARQVFKAALRTYPRPIPTPIKALRPAQVVCEQCHWPEKFYPANQVTRDHFLSNRENTHWQINLLVKVGGTSSSPTGHATGIHWHVDKENQMTYVAADNSRQAFDEVTWTRGGRTVVYARAGNPLSDEELDKRRAEGMVRRLDCMDCHNRPSHNYGSPMTVVNTLLASGKLDSALPWIKRQAVTALSREYATTEGAMDSIALSMRAFYAQEGIEVPEQAIATVQAAYRLNMFPEMRVRWNKYPDNRGHFIFTGCFRCHGSELQTPEGKRISADCNLCHTIVSQGFPDQLERMQVAEGLEFRHPVDIEGAEREMPCTDCHAGDDSNFMDF